MSVGLASLWLACAGLGASSVIAKSEGQASKVNLAKFIVYITKNYGDGGQ